MADNFEDFYKNLKGFLDHLCVSMTEEYRDLFKDKPYCKNPRIIRKKDKKDIYHLYVRFRFFGSKIEVAAIKIDKELKIVLYDPPVGKLENPFIKSLEAYLKKYNIKSQFCILTP